MMKFQLFGTRSETPRVQLLELVLTQEEAQLLMTMCVVTPVTSAEHIEQSLLEKVGEMVRRFEQTSDISLPASAVQFRA